MRIASATEFHDHVTKMVNSKEAIVITKRGRTPVGVFYPLNSKDLPKEARLAVLSALAADIHRELKLKDVSAYDIMKEFERVK